MKRVKSSMSKEARILRLFKEQRRVTQQQLARITFRFSARIGDLRKEGHEIIAIPVDPGKGKWEYQYKRGPSKKNNRDGMTYEDLPKPSFFGRLIK